MLRFASFLGDNAFEFYHQIVTYLGRATGYPTELIRDLSPEAQEAQVQQETIQAVFTCGLPYVRKADHRPPLLKVMVAPVLAAARHHDQPVYFSDVIVRADAPYHNFAALRGQSFAYNERHSLSGYLAVCHHLLSLGETQGFFGELRLSGSHAVSMDWVEQGHVTAAAIDSVVLAMELRQRPERARVFRLVASIGPLPMPPLAAVSGLSDEVYRRLIEALVTMHQDQDGQAILQSGGVRRFEPVRDSDYDPIRYILQDLERAGFMELH